MEKKKYYSRKRKKNLLLDLDQYLHIWGDDTLWQLFYPVTPSPGERQVEADVLCDRCDRWYQQSARLSRESMDYLRYNLK